MTSVVVWNGGVAVCNDGAVVCSDDMGLKSIKE